MLIFLFFFAMLYNKYGVRVGVCVALRVFTYEKIRNFPYCFVIIFVVSLQRYQTKKCKQVNN